MKYFAGGANRYVANVFWVFKMKYRYTIWNNLPSKLWNFRFAESEIKFVILHFAKPNILYAWEYFIALLFHSPQANFIEKSTCNASAFFGGSGWIRILALRRSVGVGSDSPQDCHSLPTLRSNPPQNLTKIIKAVNILVYCFYIA